MTSEPGMDLEVWKKTHPKEIRERNLGSAIFLAAIQDYRSLDEIRHEDAERFLYPKTPETWNHYHWAVGLIDGLSPAWLRSSLDRSKGKWDWQRMAHIGRAKPIRRRCKAKRKGAAGEAGKCS